MTSTQESREQLSIRVPNDLYRKTREIAKRRGVSVNTLVQEGLSMVVNNETRRVLYDSFTLLGRDAREATVDFAFDAQSEVVLNGD